ncbi:MAG TPA: EAL domain-containing protein [Vicinamibacteria bacterium]|nr:EAL domain-containing protein [Vicinamibacteria bacterium]
MSSISRKILVSLKEDRFLRWGALIAALLTVPYWVPLFSADRQYRYGDLYLEIPLIVLTLAAVGTTVRRSGSVEGHFWKLWTVVLGLWLTAKLLNLLPPADLHQELWFAFVKDAIYVAWYLFIVLSLELKPHREPASSAQPLLISLERAGATLFTFGLFVYFALIPGLANARVYESYVPSTSFYVALDAYVALRLSVLVAACASPRWKAIYASLLAAAALWLATDTTEMLMLAEVIPFVSAGTSLDLAWLLPFGPLLLAASIGRTRATIEREDDSRAGEARDFVRAIRGGPLVVYAMSAPILHVGLYSAGLLDALFRPERETCAFLLACILAVLAAAHEKLLLDDNRRLQSDKARVTAEMEHQRFHDTLTGLPNRVLFLDRLARILPRSKRDGLKAAVLYLDLDRLTAVNASLGYPFGDALLQAVARRLEANVRREDTLARMGGDEFAFAVQAIRRVEDAVKVATAHLESLRAPFVIGGHEAYVTGSIGISIFSEDGEDETTLMKSAQIAMHRAKERGGDACELFAPEMNARTRERLEIENSLRAAVEQNQFVLHYQPIVELSSNHVSGCEALIRWQHPVKGLLFPKDFLDLAELTRVTRQLRPWILRTACSDLASWKKDGEGQLSVAVNLSARQLLEPGLVEEIRAALDEAHLAPRFLELEITETLIIEDLEATGKTLEEIRRLGVRISVDDFGTGYSSLSYLQRLPVDTLKIDQIFLRKTDNTAILAAVVAMAKSLGLSVTVEGIEREGQLARVKELGCDRAQGYFFGPPVSSQEFASRFKRYHPAAHAKRVG